MRRTRKSRPKSGYRKVRRNPTGITHITADITDITADITANITNITADITDITADITDITNITNITADLTADITENGHLIIVDVVEEYLPRTDRRKMQ